MDKNKYSSDMKKEIKEICTELNDGKIAVVQATEKLLNLFSVSNCECKNLPEGEIAISSRALTDPNWKG